MRLSSRFSLPDNTKGLGNTVDLVLPFLYSFFCLFCRTMPYLLPVHSSPDVNNFFFVQKRNIKLGLGTVFLA